MPGGDGTGPAGMGPMTGRAAGYMNPMGGRGFWGWGRGRGGGWGWRNRFYATGVPGWQQAAVGGPAWGGPWPSGQAYASPFAPTMTRDQELDALKGQAKYFEDALEGIRKRVEELQAQAAEKKG